MLTEEQITQLVADGVAAALPEAVKSAIAASMPSLIEAAGAQSAEQVAALTASLEALKAKPADKAPAGEKTLSAAEIRLARLEAELGDERSKREAAEASSAETRLMASFRDAAAKSGIAPDRIPHALALLHNANGRISLNEAGESVMRMKGAYGEETVALSEGLKTWTAGEGAAFLPPSPVQGSGERVGGSPRLTSGKPVTAANLINIFRTQAKTA